MSTDDKRLTCIAEWFSVLTFVSISTFREW